MRAIWIWIARLYVRATRNIAATQMTADQMAVRKKLTRLLEKEPK